MKKKRTHPTHHTARRWQSANTALGASAFILLLFSVISSPELYINGPQMLASVVSATATVPPNPYNTLAEELAIKEARILERERAIAQAPVTTESRTDTFLATSSLIASGVLFLLLGMNFYADWRRQKRGVSGRVVVS